jgi:hypothetical protein
MSDQISTTMERTAIPPLVSTDLFGVPVVDEEASAQMAAGDGVQEIYTPDDLAKLIVQHFRPSGKICEPCRGDGAFVRAMPGCDWYEKADGKDFMLAEGKWDWIVTNPPWNDVRIFLRKSMTHADNIVFLCWASAWWTKARQREIRECGFGMVEMCFVPTPPAPWPQSGFLLAAVWLRRGWTGSTKLGTPNVKS